MNDGKSTEIISDKIIEGAQIVIGADANDDQNKNQFAGKHGKLIEVDHLVRTYTLGEVEVHALRGISVEVSKGEFVAIIWTAVQALK